MAGLDFVVNAFLNAECDVAGLVCGDVVEAHREGVKVARSHYATELVRDADVALRCLENGARNYLVKPPELQHKPELTCYLYQLPPCIRLSLQLLPKSLREEMFS